MNPTYPGWPIQQSRVGVAAEVGIHEMWEVEEVSVLDEKCGGWGVILQARENVAMYAVGHVLLRGVVYSGETGGC